MIKATKTNTTLLLVVMALAVCSLAFPIWATCTIGTETITDYKEFSIHEATVTMSSNGAVAWPSSIYGMVLAVETNPGTTAPTDNYDITLTDADGADIMGTALMNRDTSNTEITCPTLGYQSKAPAAGALTVNVTNNSVNNATVKIRIFTQGEKKGILSW